MPELFAILHERKFVANADHGDAVTVKTGASLQGLAKVDLPNRLTLAQIDQCDLSGSTRHGNFLVNDLQTLGQLNRRG